MADQRLPPLRSRRRRAARSLFSARSLAARAQFGRQHDARSSPDADDRKLTYDDIVRAAFALGHALKTGTKRGETVGIMLPTGVGAVIAFFAIHAYGRVPAMLNFTAGARNLEGGAARRRRSSASSPRTLRRARQARGARSVAVDRRQDRLSRRRAREAVAVDKVAAVVGSILPRRVATRGLATTRRPSSCSPRAPRATRRASCSPTPTSSPTSSRCARTSRSIRDDVLFNPLPTFHCFGLTVGALLPLYLGVKAVLHPSPLQAQRSPSASSEHRGDDPARDRHLHLAIRARASDEDDLSRLRLAVCGAERVRDETRQLFAARIHGRDARRLRRDRSRARHRRQPAGREPPRHGRPAHAGMECEARAGRRHPECAAASSCAGPNVMQGYLKPDQPGELQPLPDGWHDTGDVVAHRR